MGRRLNTTGADEHERLNLDPSGHFWIEAWTDYVGDQSRAEWLSHEEAARWYATAHGDDWRCGLSDAPQELSGLVREIGNHRVLSAYTVHGAVSCTASSSQGKARPRRSPRRSIHQTQARDGATGNSAATRKYSALLTKGDNRP